MNQKLFKTGLILMLLGAALLLAGCSSAKEAATQIPPHEHKYILPGGNLMSKCGDCESERKCVICERYLERQVGPAFYNYNTENYTENGNNEE